MGKANGINPSRRRCRSRRLRDSDLTRGRRPALAAVRRAFSLLEPSEEACACAASLVFRVPEAELDAPPESSHLACPPLLPALLDQCVAGALPSDFGTRLWHAKQNLSFDGLSGTVRFDGTGNRDAATANVQLSNYVLGAGGAWGEAVRARSCAAISGIGEAEL